ncbi:MAG TPA: DUF58 domain-containing protein [Planctomycetota bacterium]|nr:DUF58 domain-containing protein [Planctomycetota bacterium]
MSLAGLKRFVRSLRPEKETGAANVLFPPGFLASLERLRLVALKAIGGGLREGHRLGAYKGGQLEFHGHRNYVPGDELRYIDWNSFARLDKPYIKEFAREEAGIVHLLVDGTPSMGLGEPSKWIFARRLAALFAHVALLSKDRAKLYVFKGLQDKLEIYPRSGQRAGIRQYLRFLEEQALARVPENGAYESAGTFAHAIEHFVRMQPERGRVIVIGDFWFPETEIIAAIGRLAGSGFDVSAIHVLAPEEIVPDAEGNLLARAVEESGEVELSSSPDLPQRYAAELERHRRTIEDAIRRRGGLYLLERSDTSIEHALIGALRQRRWVM